MEHCRREGEGPALGQCCRVAEIGVVGGETGFRLDNEPAPGFLRQRVPGAGAVVGVEEGLPCFLAASGPDMLDESAGDLHQRPVMLLLAGLVEDGHGHRLHQHQAAYRCGILRHQPQGHPAPIGVSHQMHGFLTAGVGHHGAHQIRLGIVAALFRGARPGVRAPEPVMIHGDQPVAVLQHPVDLPPLGSGASPAVQQHHRLARAAFAVMDPDSVDVEIGHVSPGDLDVIERTAALFHPCSLPSH